MKYNTNDLMLGRYNYSYDINVAKNDFVSIIGERMGVLFLSNNGYIDLITGDYVLEKDIITKKPFAARDSEIGISSVVRIFEGLEDVCEYMATEKQADEENLYAGLPSIITFKASEMKHGIESMASCDEKTNEMVSKVKRFSLRFKRK